jgi:glycosyltransferase involved in cell wall biosynthesis
MIIPNVKGFILHDYLQVNGGAERLVIFLSKKLNISLVVSGIYKDFNFERNGIQNEKIIILYKPLNFFPRLFKSFISFNLKLKLITNADYVIYSGLFSLLTSYSQHRGVKIFYCHSAPKFLYQKKYNDKYFFLLKPFYIIFKIIYKYLYVKSLNDMDLIIVNSKFTQINLNKYTNKKTYIIYPPINISSNKWIGQSDYYLSIGRLEPKKNIKMIIEAFKRMPTKKLIITSGGSEIEYLKFISKDYNNISFTGWLNDYDLQKLIGNCIATIYIPSDEDFGMSTIESFSAGKPVVGLNCGGLLETISHFKTGYIVDNQNIINDLIYSINLFTKDYCLNLRHNCEKEASKFDDSIFFENFYKKLKYCLLNKKNGRAQSPSATIF